MSDLFGNHIVGFSTRWLICLDLPDLSWEGWLAGDLTVCRLGCGNVRWVGVPWPLAGYQHLPGS